jgi:hypothetical protein
MKTTMRFFSFALGICIFLAACSKNEKQVPIQLLLTDNPAAYDSVNVHIKSIQVKINQEDAGWTTIQSKDTTVNLLDLQNGVTMVLAQDNVPDGVLKEVRFILGSDNYVVVDGTKYPMQAPSAESSGLKIKIDKELNETLNTFTLDFDAALSVKEENGSYKLMPVIKLKP